MAAPEREMLPWLSHRSLRTPIRPKVPVKSARTVGRPNSSCYQSVGVVLVVSRVTEVSDP